MNDLLTALRADGVGAVALLLKAIEIKSASECHFGSVHGHDGVCVVFERERESFQFRFVYSQPIRIESREREKERKKERKLER